MGIIAVLAAVAFPVAANSKRQGQIAADINKLHQCQLAVALYQGDHESSGSPLGLPSIEDILYGFKTKSFYGLTTEDMQSACGKHPMVKGKSFIYFPGSLSNREGAYYGSVGENGILFADAHCNESSVDPEAIYMTKLGIGVRVNGSIIRRRGVGRIDSVDFWKDYGGE